MEIPDVEIKLTKLQFHTFPYTALAHTLHTSPFPLSLPVFPFTCQEAKEALATDAVPDEERVGRCTIPELHMNALGAQPHLQVAQLQYWVAVLLLQPIRELASAGRKQCSGISKCVVTVS